MNDEYITVPTTSKVWWAIRNAHPDMVVYSSFSAPCGSLYTSFTKGEMFTSYGFKQGDFPVMEARTRWNMNSEKPSERDNERHEYWLCLPKKVYD